MKKTVSFICIMLLLVSMISILPTTAATNAGFKVSGTNLLDANGNAFIIRGINHAHTWYKDQLSTVIPTLAKAGCNTVRIVLSNGVQWTEDSASSVKNIISLCEQNKLVAVLEVHDATGKNDQQSLLAAANYFVKIKDALVGKEDRVIINIANEWQGEWNGANWASAYKSAIPVIRNAGLTHTIMVDAGGWGQYGQSVKDYGKDVFNADTLKNTIFSIHMYGTAGKDATTIKTNIDGVINQGLALCIGEFGWNHSDGDVDEATIMSYCKEKNVGWMAWSWKGNGGGVEYLDLSSDWTGNSLSTWGNTVVSGPNGLKQTSVICSVFGNSPQPTVSPSTSPVPSSTSPAPLSTFPILSRNVPAFASSDMATNANDSSYGTSWRGMVPGWIAYDLSKVSAAQRSQVVAVWYNDTYDYDPSIKSTGSYNVPSTYTIEGNAAAGGGNAPTSGWVTLATVSNNIYHSRQHVINLSGYNWVRMNVSAVKSISGNAVSINLDIYNAAQALHDDWIFYGDSITAGGMVVNSSGSGTFAEIVNASKPSYFPIAECGGVGSILSSHGAQYINTWLSVFPGKYVGIAYGTNDSWGNQAGTTVYYKNMETIVKAVLAAGKVPVVSKIPFSKLSDIQKYAPSYNAQIDALYTAYPQIIKGPDFWTFFQNNPNLLSSDNVHPSTEGFSAMRQQWANTMLAAVYNNVTVTPSVVPTITPTIVPTPTPTVSDNTYDFKVDTVFSPSRLVANQMLTAKVTVTNTTSSYYSGTKDVLLIVGLYDKNNTMANVSYISKGISYQGVETLSAGFKLPMSVDGYCVRAFVWDGTDLKTTNMIPLSNVTQLP